jgi:hypothetical protein
MLEVGAAEAAADAATDPLDAADPVAGVEVCARAVGALLELASPPPLAGPQPPRLMTATKTKGDASFTASGYHASSPRGRTNRDACSSRSHPRSLEDAG